jgi:hypothetical protein
MSRRKINPFEFIVILLVDINEKKEPMNQHVNFDEKNMVALKRAVRNDDEE